MNQQEIVLIDRLMANTSSEIAKALSRIIERVETRIDGAERLASRLSIVEGKIGIMQEAKINARKLHLQSRPRRRRRKLPVV